MMEFYRVKVTADAGGVARVLFSPSPLVLVRWAFFFDGDAVGLELSEVKINNYEQLVRPAPASLFVFNMPVFTLPRVRAADRAEIALYNPTAEPITATVWIGELEAVRAELTRQRN